MAAGRLGREDYIKLCNDYFKELVDRLPHFVPSGFPPLRYGPKGQPYIACLARYAYPKWFCAVVPKYAKQDEQCVAVAFAMPLELRRRFPEAELAKRFREAGIKGDYPGTENGFYFGPAFGGKRYNVAVRLSADIRESKGWGAYHEWQAQTMPRMKPIVDEVW